MLVATKNSLYEFDPDSSRFRKLKPHLSDWITYIGMKDEPMVGEPLIILQTETTLTTTTVVSIEEDEL